MPENQRVMVDSLGFFDLIFVFRKRLISVAEVFIM